MADQQHPTSLHPEVRFILDFAATQIAGPCGLLLTHATDIASLSQPELAGHLHAAYAPIAAALSQLRDEGVVFETESGPSPLGGCVGLARDRRRSRWQ